MKKSKNIYEKISVLITLLFFMFVTGASSIISFLLIVAGFNQILSVLLLVGNFFLFGWIFFLYVKYNCEDD